MEPFYGIAYNLLLSFHFHFISCHMGPRQAGTGTGEAEPDSRLYSGCMLLTGHLSSAHRRGARRRTPLV